MGKSNEPWSRTQLTIRLTGRRKQLLLKLAALAEPGCTPGEAIDVAIRTALDERGPGELEARMQSVEDTLEAMDSERRFEAARIERALKKLESGVAALHALIAELAGE